MGPGFSNREVTWTSARVPSEDCGYWSEAGRRGGREGSEAETTRASGHKREEKAKVGWVEERNVGEWVLQMAAAWGNFGAERTGAGG